MATKKATKKAASKGSNGANTGKRRINFKVSADPGSQVFLAGDFNNWDPLKKKLKEDEDGSFTGVVLLNKGEYQYKFVINGQWSIDPNREWVPNDLGSLNSIVKV